MSEHNNIIFQRTQQIGNNISYGGNMHSSSQEETEHYNTTYCFTQSGSLLQERTKECTYNYLGYSLDPRVLDSKIVPFGAANMSLIDKIE